MLQVFACAHGPGVLIHPVSGTTALSASCAAKAPPMASMIANAGTIVLKILFIILNLKLRSTLLQVFDLPLIPAGYIVYYLSPLTKVKIGVAHLIRHEVMIRQAIQSVSVYLEALYLFLLIVIQVKTELIRVLQKVINVDD